MEYQKIQAWVLPEGSSLRANELYFRRSSEVVYDRISRKLQIPQDGYVDFSTYFNGYFLNEWKLKTRYEKLRIRIHSKGNLVWNLCAGYRDQEEQRIQITKAPEMEWGAVNIPEEWMEDVPTICYLAVAGGEGGGEILNLSLEGILKEEEKIVPALILGEWEDELLLKRNLLYLLEQRKRNGGFPEIYLADKDQKAERFFQERNLDVSEIHFLHSSNGQSLWSGYRAGVEEVLEKLSERACSHLIFLKGDAQLPPDTLERTITVLKGLKEEYQNAELAGALLEIDRCWVQRGSGNLWNQGQPKFLHEDLEMRDMDAILEDSEAEEAEYGGWWYCCIPIKAVQEKGLPLPLRMEEAAAEYGLRLGRVFTFNGIGVWDRMAERRLPQSGEYYKIRNAAIVNACRCTLRDWGHEEMKQLLRKKVTENVARGRYLYALMNLMGARDFLRGAKCFLQTDEEQLRKEREERITPLHAYEEIVDSLPEGVYETGVEVKIRKILLKKHILYRDDRGKCLLVEKNPAQGRICMKQLRKMEHSIDQYFVRAAESFRENMPIMPCEKR